MPEPVVPAVWGPERCSRAGCDGPLPRGLVLLERTEHIDCREAREAWKHLNALGKAPATAG